MYINLNSNCVCVMLPQAKSQMFVDYQKQVIKNSQALANRLLEKDYTLITGNQPAQLGSVAYIVTFQITKGLFFFMEKAY